MSIGETDAPRPPLDPSIRAFLSRKDVVEWVKARVSGKVGSFYREETAQDALKRALLAAWPPSQEEKVLWATLETIVARTIADHYKKRSRRKKYEGPVPTAHTGDDPSNEEPQPVEVPDPATLPTTYDPRVEGRLLREYLTRAVRDNARDAETLAWILAWSDDEKGYQAIAAEHGLTLVAVSSRVHAFKKKYLPRYRRYRDGALLLILLLLLLVIAALARSRWLPDVEEPRPLPTSGPVPVIRSASPDSTFDQARPRPPPLREERPDKVAPPEK